jgi:hypothetical protein
MRLLCTLLLVCLVAAGPAAAIAASPGSMSLPVKASPAVQYVTVVTVNPSITLPVTTTPPPTPVPLSPMLYVSSTPSGASVAVNGVAKGKTPLTLGLYPGTYTVLITLDGYRDYTTTVTLSDSDKVAIDARFQPVLSAGALRQTLSVIAPAMPASVINRTNLTVTVTTPRGMTQCPPGQQCMTPAEAEAALLPGWSPAGTGPCDEVLNADNEHIGFRYCMVGTLKPGLQPGIVQPAGALVPITRIPVVNQTLIPNGTQQPPGGQQQGGIVERLRAPLAEPWDEMPAGQQQGGFIESFFSFIGSFFPSL